MALIHIPAMSRRVSDLPTEGDNPREARASVQDRRTPRWVKVLGILVLVFLALIVISSLFGIQHGPDIHSSWIAFDSLASVWALSAA